MALVEDKGECVRVIVRMRPMNSKEKERNEPTCVSIDTKSGRVNVRKYVF